MEELQVIETTSGRRFKPWASREDVQAIKQETVQAVLQAVQDPASITAIASDIASGKAAIAEAINVKGGSASASESFAELAEAVGGIPNFDDMARLAGIISGGSYDKSQLQGIAENQLYGSDTIKDVLGSFKNVNINYTFQHWELLKSVIFPQISTLYGSNIFNSCILLESVTLPELATISGSAVFKGCISLETIILPKLATISGGYNIASGVFSGCLSLKIALFPSVSVISGTYLFVDCGALRYIEFGTLTLSRELLVNNKPNLRNITIGQDTNINLDFHNWIATNVIAEGQSGIDELNTNLQTNLISKLYQGGGKILRLGAALYDVTTQETRDMVTSKGWTLQRG